MNGMKQKPNRLINEKSPYLLQHAYNPVDWYPWGDEAFEVAIRENKPIFLSIGYSTCHWCHVMAHESFEDEKVARLINEVFVPIKVDREERPDIDNIYMTVCQAMTGHGGWPLTIIMTPDKKPFFAGTYISKHSRYGRKGLVDLINEIRMLWENEHDEIIDSAEKITYTIQKFLKESPGDEMGEDTLYTAYIQLESMFDMQYGGFGTAPKFPTPHNLYFLLRFYRRFNKNEALDMVLKTLDSMSLGGIFDHIGFGFHRYSTDRRWLLPHFEKMLYDQALIAMAYTEAYQITGSEKYKEMAEKIFEYVMRDMMSEEGAFYSAEDADSEGEEGKFYTWSVDEVMDILGEEEGKLAVKLFNFKKEGNFRDEATGERTGFNIVNFSKDIEKLAEDLKINDIKEKLKNIREKLYNAREKRERPHRDDKILTDWNGLMIASLSKAAAALGNKKYAEAAKKAADFILDSFGENGRLMHRYRKGEWKVIANVDDYSFLIFGLLELYGASFEEKYLKYALKLNEELIDYFWDEKNGGFYFTSKDEEEILIRTKEVYDGAVPSGNSVALLNLLRIGRITGNSKYDDFAAKLQRAFSKSVMDTPMGYTQMLVGLDFSLGPSLEIVIAGKRNSEDTLNMIKVLQRRFIPNAVLLLNPAGEENPEIHSIAEYTRLQKSIDGRATAYVCRNFACSEPATTVEEMLNKL
ncbi:thioredoxin domain-containing protein [Fonticella tunisiensis]|uniref:Spermatogenesis-associated protein 20-like TRX domain-containing protein n=1 Tax=Fonticella tunisiensis TaxID=1096341 RepID=A0A4V3EUM5_9CLOT|nr:thioredoxin domain-containing protein [Fonticella tunisiensis]TDT63695.1 hypothetical protein EDD71_101122 [Fonticella tunisiensis]